MVVLDNGGHVDECGVGGHLHRVSGLCCKLGLWLRVANKVTLNAGLIDTAAAASFFFPNTPDPQALEPPRRPHPTASIDDVLPARDLLHRPPRRRTPPPPRPASPIPCRLTPNPPRPPRAAVSMTSSTPPAPLALLHRAHLAPLRLRPPPPRPPLGPPPTRPTEARPPPLATTRDAVEGHPAGDPDEAGLPVARPLLRRATAPAPPPTCCCPGPSSDELLSQPLPVDKVPRCPCPRRVDLPRRHLVFDVRSSSSRCLAAFRGTKKFEHEVYGNNLQRGF
ncbi:hypothetical protein EJB05_46945, partial [Eragrostis curvula]